MGLLGRAPRAAASAVLAAGVIGMAGMTGIAGAVAVDPVGSVSLVGVLVDKHDVAIGGIQLIVSEEQAPDGPLAGFQATTADDGSFTVQLYRWGTPAAPASVTIRTTPDQTITREHDGCSETVSVDLSDVRQLALADPAVTPKPIDLVATTVVRGGACGTTATPPTDSGAGGAAGHTARPRVTPPATDALAGSRSASTERLGSALVLGFVGGLVAAAALVTPRHRGARRRR